MAANETWLAWAYLVACGSPVAFTAYVRSLCLLPMNVVMTHAYVNPVVAVLLGRLVLNKTITGWTTGGATLVILGVAGVFRARAGRGAQVHRAVARDPALALGRGSEWCEVTICEFPHARPHGRSVMCR